METTNETKLPTYDACAQAVQTAGKATALERFIYAYEPAFQQDWRTDLAAVLSENSRALPLEVQRVVDAALRVHEMATRKVEPYATHNQFHMANLEFQAAVAALDAATPAQGAATEKEAQ